jgi:hypothetical protein
MGPPVVVKIGRNVRVDREVLERRISKGLA